LTLILFQTSFVMDSRRLARVPILVLGGLPNHTAWSCLSSVCISLGIAGLGAGPPRSLHHAILLAFSVDPGVRPLMQMAFAFPLQLQRSGSSQHCQCECDVIFAFPSRDRAGKTTSLPVLTSNTEYGLHIPLHSIASLIKAKSSDGEVHGLQGIFRWFTSPVHSVTPQKPAQILANV
jgi:hypothetical protein